MPHYSVEYSSTLPLYPIKTVQKPKRVRKFFFLIAWNCGKCNRLWNTFLVCVRVYILKVLYHIPVCATKASKLVYSFQQHAKRNYLPRKSFQTISNCFWCIASIYWNIKLGKINFSLELNQKKQTKVLFICFCFIICCFESCEKLSHRHKIHLLISEFRSWIWLSCTM